MNTSNVPDKQQLLLEIRQMIQSGDLSEAEVLAQFGSLSNLASNQSSDSHSLRLSEIMYYIGATIIFIGISVLCYQNWDLFNSATRILVTLGSSIAAFVVGALLYSREDLKKASQGFFLLSAVLAPIGLNVLFKEGGMDLSSDSLQFAVYLILSAVFISSLKFFKQTVLIFFSVFFTTALFHFIINLIIGENFLMDNYEKIWEYRILAAGLAWVSLGYYLKDTSYKAITGILYGFGIIYILGSSLALGGWQPEQNVFWELVYPLVVFGAIFASVYLKSKSFLVFGTIFLIIYILKLTGEYFTSGLGWPLALVLAGLGIMGVGYWAVKLNKKYFSHTI
jgi:hypothetical protein